MPATLAACPDNLEQWIGACMFGTSVWSEAHDSVQSLDVTDYKKNYPLMNLSLVMTIQDDDDVVLVTCTRHEHQQSGVGHHEPYQTEATASNSHPLVALWGSLL